MEIELPTRAAGVLTDQTGVMGLADGPPQSLRLPAVLAAHVNVGGIGADGEGGQQSALDNLVGFAAEDFPVLAGAGLALVGVDDEVMRPAAGFLGHERPFHAGAEAGAAAPAEAGVLDLLDNPIAALFDQLLGFVPIAAPARAFKADVPLAVNVGEDAVPVLEHQASPDRSP